MQIFNRVAQAENVGQSDLISSEPCCTTQENNPHVKYQTMLYAMLYHV